MKNTKPHQFQTSIDQSKYHNNTQCCSSHGMVEPLFREKSAVFDEKYQTSPIPNIHWSIQIPQQQAMVFITRHRETIISWKTSVFDEKYQTSLIPNIHWSIQIPQLIKTNSRFGFPTPDYPSVKFYVKWFHLFLPFFSTNQWLADTQASKQASKQANNLCLQDSSLREREQVTLVCGLA